MDGEATSEVALNASDLLVLMRELGRVTAECNHLKYERQEIIDNALKEQAALEEENRRLRDALDETRRRAMTLGYTGLAHFIGVTMMEIDAALATEPASGEATSQSSNNRGYAAPPPPPKQGGAAEELHRRGVRIEELRARLADMMEANKGMAAERDEALSALRQRADEAARNENIGCAALVERLLQRTYPMDSAYEPIVAAIRARIAR